MITPTHSKTQKAVGLISGGLDSILAAKIIKDLGFEVHGIHFSMPWNVSEKAMAYESAKEIGIKYINIKLNDDYLQMVRDPKYGYGRAMNPCVNCHAYMLKEASEYMASIGASFVFTGEVLGQRPMSQRRRCLSWVEKDAGLEGRLLRPLSAQCLEPTIPEKEGIINRAKLLDITGRSRRIQIQLAEDLNIAKYSQPAGGCLLTDKNFSNRIKDAFEYGYKDLNDIIVLQWGRHFRLSKDFKAIVGRDEKENDSIEKYARPGDHIMLFADEQMTGPTVLLKGENPSEKILSLAAGFIQYFSRYKNDESTKIRYWAVCHPEQINTITAQKLDASTVQELSLNH